MIHTALNTETDPVVAHNNEAYSRSGFGAQRKYPNEEFCRFMGRNFFGIDMAERSKVRILEVGCGSASNLWMIAREGFDAYGVDNSSAALPLAKEMLNRYGAVAHLELGDMTALPHADNYFDAVVDVYSSYCINEQGFGRMLSEVSRVLKPGGKFFIYTPGKGSDAWTNYAPADKLDSSTLTGIARASSAYYPSPYPFRFINLAELEDNLNAHGLSIDHAETVTRTYQRGKEFFEFVVAEATKK